jgi:hypothetical protein
MMKRIFLILMICLISSMSSAVVLLDDTWADGSRAETNLPTESATWISDDALVAVTPGSLAYTQDTGSNRMWTYFTADGSPASLGVGHKLIASAQFTPTGLYTSDAENFRMGVYHDPTSPQVLLDSNDDGGGTGDPWSDSEGYGVRVVLSNGAGDNPQVGKRVYNYGTSTSLLGSSGDYEWLSSGPDVENMTDGTLYTASLTMERLGINEMNVTFALSDAGGDLTTLTLNDDGTFGGMPIFTNFDHFFFRFSKAEGTADVLDFSRLTVEHIVPEPASMALLGLGGLFAIRRKR